MNKRQLAVVWIVAIVLSAWIIYGSVVEGDTPYTLITRSVPVVLIGAAAWITLGRKGGRE
jgi:hypothetical protein